MFLLHAAYEELNLIQFMTYIHPLQMMIKTLRAQMESKTLTRVPTDEIAYANSSEKSFSRHVSSFSFTIPVLSKYHCKKKHRANNFQAIRICKHAFIDLHVMIIILNHDN